MMIQTRILRSSVQDDKALADPNGTNKVDQNEISKDIHERMSDHHFT